MTNPIATQVVAAALDEALRSQPWWKRYAGTVTAIVSGLATLIPIVLTVWAGAPAWIVTVLGGAAVVLMALSQRLTKNGITPRGNAEVEKVIEPSIADTVLERLPDLPPMPPLPSASAVFQEALSRITGGRRA